GTSCHDRQDSKIALSEALTNAVKHPYKKNSQIGMINLSFQIFHHTIKILISHQAQTFHYQPTKSHLPPYNHNQNIHFV
ncbi:ATP-binding protein, partial [Staphylococcus epidermidis]|uniref:ATP-binding protein n=1 Tax=Staphylococcus epidermidis TaxID=1282 RepID=UPI001642C584